MIYRIESFKEFMKLKDDESLRWVWSDSADRFACIPYSNKTIFSFLDCNWVEEIRSLKDWYNYFGLHYKNLYIVDISYHNLIRLLSKE